MALVEIKVPDIGDFDEVAVIELLVKAGDTVTAEQSLITVESDKASMEIPSTHAGVVKEIKVKVNDKVSEGSLILVVEAAGAAAPRFPLAKTARHRPDDLCPQRSQSEPARHPRAGDLRPCDTEGCRGALPRGRQAAWLCDRIPPEQP